MTDRHQPPPPHRRKTPSFSSSLLDSILRSIDESNEDKDGVFLRCDHEQQHVHHHYNNHELRLCDSKLKRSNKIQLQRTQMKNEEEERMPSLRRIDQWMESHSNKNNRNGYASTKSCSKFSSDSSSSGETETPSTHRSLPNSFTISREAVFLDDTQKPSSKKVEGKLLKSTKLRAMKIYGDLKKVKQPISPGSRISAFIYSLFGSSSSKKTKQDTTMTYTSRSCMSKKQASSSVKRSVRFYPVTDTDRKSIDERGSNSMQMPKYERRMNNYKSFMVEDEDEDEDDLFELEIVGGVGSRAYGQELPVFETTDLRKIRI